MAWKIRKDGDPSIPAGRSSPEYGPCSEFFTIRMHHNGLFVNLGKITYVASDIAHIDYCHPDEMSLLELNSMATEIGMKPFICFHFSRSGVDDSSDLKQLQNDNDALNLVNFVDDNRIIGVFVEHEKIVASPTESQTSMHDFPTVNEAVNFIGENEDHIDINLDQTNCVDGGGLGGNEHINLKSDILDDNDSNASDDDQSIGSDSDISENFVDSEYDVSDDDNLFDDNIDVDVEWGGLNVCKSEATTSTEVCNKSGSENKNIYNGNPVFNPRLDLNDPKFELGMYFSDIPMFRQAVRNHSIKQGRDIMFTINEKNKVQAKCKHETCPWVIYARKEKNEDSVQVKTYYGKHQCPRLQRVSHANSKFVSQMYKDRIWTDPKWPVDSMMTILQKDCKLVFNKSQMYRAKKKVFHMGNGSDSEQYAMLWSYAEEIRNSNPGTTVKIKCKLVGEQSVFKRIYICWGALKMGFLEGCRPVIFLDGCHLKTSAGGVLLTAVGVDANNCMYPFAYAIVEKEKKKSWLWFVELLVQDLNITNSYHWTIVSDKKNGLIDAIETLLPDSEHRFCVMHLYKNFKQNHKGLALKNLLWQAARATRVVDFKRTMAELKERNVAAYDWLSQRAPANWSRSHFRTLSKCDILLNNMSESFNSMIMRGRCRPILSMLEIVRVILMRRVHVRRDQMEKYHGDICPKISKLLEETKKKSMDFIAHWNGQDQFEVENCHGTRFKVHLGERACSCRRWELTGLPCAHAICSFYYLGHTSEAYVDQCYKKETFMKAYNHLMGTLDDTSMWPKVDLPTLLPPVCEKLPGRPKKHNRRKEFGETNISQKIDERSQHVRLGKKGVTMTCSRCKKPNHNVRGCPLLKPSQPTQEGLDVPAAVNIKEPAKKGKKQIVHENEFDSSDPNTSGQSRKRLLSGSPKVQTRQMGVQTRSCALLSPSKIQTRSTGKGLVTIPTQQSQAQENAQKKTLGVRAKLKVTKKTVIRSSKPNSPKSKAFTSPVVKHQGTSSSTITQSVRFSKNKKTDYKFEQKNVCIKEQEEAPTCNQM